MRRKVAITLSAAIAFVLSACDTSPDSKVSRLEPEAILPAVPAQVPRGEGELVETRDLFLGKPVLIQVETDQGRVTRDYVAERRFVLSTTPIREQNGFLIFDSIGEASIRPDGYVYVKTAPVRSRRSDWFVLCTRWKPKWEPAHGCVLLGRKDAKHYEVDIEESDLSVAEELNAFVLTHL